MKTHLKSALAAGVAAAALVAGPLSLSAQQSTTPSSPPAASGSTSGSSSMAGESLAAQGRELIGKDLYGANDEKVGEIDDVVMGSGQEVTHVLVDVGGFLGMGAKTIAVPIDQLSPGAEEDRIMAASLTKEQAEQMPEYEKGSSPSGTTGGGMGGSTGTTGGATSPSR